MVKFLPNLLVKRPFLGGSLISISAWAALLGFLAVAFPHPIPHPCPIASTPTAPKAEVERPDCTDPDNLFPIANIEESAIASELARLSERFQVIPGARFVDRQDFADACRQARNVVARKIMRRIQPQLFDAQVLPYEETLPQASKGPAPGG